MRVIKPNGTVIRYLTPQERNWLRSLRQGHAIGSRDDRSRLQNLLTQLRDQKLWIRCDCKDESDGAALHVYRRDGALRVRSHTAEDSHHPDCPFRPSERDSHSYRTSPIQSHKVLAFHQAGRVPAGGDGSPRSARYVAGQRRPKLLSWLLTLMDEAGYTQFRPGDQSHRVESLVESAGNWQVWRGVSADTFMLQDFSNAVVIQLGRALRDYRRDHPEVEAYGLLWGHVTRWDAAQAMLFQGPSKHHMNGTATVMGHPRTEGPYLALATVAQGHDTTTPWAYHLSRLALVPVADASCLVPCESSLERQATLAFIGLLRWLQKKFGCTLELRKPVFDMGAEDDFYRPDFVLYDHVRGNRCAIEVMGFSNEEYRQRKARLIPLLKRDFDHVVEVDMAEKSDTECIEALKEAKRVVCRWALAGRPRP